MFTTIRTQFEQLLWHTRTREVSRGKALLIRTLRIGYAAARDLGGGLPSLRAMGLVYTTLLSLVPLLAVSFSVLKGFGVHNQLKPALVNLLEPLGEKGEQLSQQIIGFVDNMNVGVLGSLGLLFLIFTVLSLVKKIESAFNFTWRISVTRNIFQRFSNYLSVILIGPLLLFTAAGINASFNSSKVVDSLLSVEPLGSLLLLLGEILPYLLIIVSFTLIYILIPNTKVRFRSALFGAIFATLLWKLVGVIFTSFIVDSTNYTAIYSGFAIVIIFMLWIYACWLIVLTGASLAYYHQHPDRVTDRSQVIRLSCRLREKLALTVMQLIGDSFHHNKEAWTMKRLANKTGMSESALEIILNSLISRDLLLTSGEDNQFYQPAQSLEHITLDKILNAARSAEETSLLRADDVIAAETVTETVEQIEEAISDTLQDKTLKDLI